MVSEELDITQADLLQCFNNAYDTHDSEWRTRVMYKYNSAKHNTGTPFAYVNGVLLENFPETTDEWFDMLNTVYQS
jgi:hypothetical protein